ncbi:hypothetical protein [Noviherbaspirillum pedocola]|nr:hypothetical protein [Noviherbaspirillum pedocola]
MNDAMSVEETQNEFGFEGDTGYRNGDTAPDAVRAFLTGLNNDDLWQHLNAADLGDGEGDGDLGSVDGEENIVGASPMDQELAIAALRDLSNLGGSKRRKKEDSLRTFTEEDFEEGPERISFMMVRANIMALFDKKRKPAEVLKAAEWVFGLPETAFTFERCCQALGARKDVLRLRIHYEFWRTWYVLPIEFPFLIEPLPAIVADEIYMLAGDEGIDLARAAWMKPGIRAVELLQVASGQEKAPDSYIRALEVLGNKYFLSQQGDYWYLTGRNPIVRSHDLENSAYRRSIHNVSWSKMF